MSEGGGGLSAKATDSILDFCNGILITDLHRKHIGQNGNRSVTDTFSLLRDYDLGYRYCTEIQIGYSTDCWE